MSQKLATEDHCKFVIRKSACSQSLEATDYNMHLPFVHHNKKLSLMDTGPTNTQVFNSKT